jgi:hypothetical protein
MDLNEITDPEVLALFAEYDKELSSFIKKSDPKKAAPAKRGTVRAKIEETKRKKVRPVRRAFDYDGGIRNLHWEYQ